VTREPASSGHITGWAVSAGTSALSGVHLGPKALALVPLVVLVGGVLYLIGCRIWPYGPCLACRVHPRRNRGSNKRRHGRCRVGKGSGERLRLGTRVLRASGYKGGRWPS
jgi:hypothetical protein